MMDLLGKTGASDAFVEEINQKKQKEEEERERKEQEKERNSATFLG